MPGRRRRLARDAADRPAPDLAAAMEVAARYLGARPRTRRELELRLRRAGVDDEVLDTALGRLAQLGYVDDEAFARWWSEQRDRHAPRGRRLVEAELRQRGVPREVIEQMRDEPIERAPEDQALPETEEDRAGIALDRHLRGRGVPDDPKAIQRLGMFLMRRGFAPEVARHAIRERLGR